MKEQREGQNPQEGSLESKALCQTRSKAFEMSKATAKVSPKHLKEDDQDSVKKGDRQQNAPCGTHTVDQRGGHQRIDA